MTSSAPSATLGFVNRVQEMKRILNELNVARTGKGQLLIIRGEAGSGKTRLVQEAAAEAEKLGFSVGFGTALAESVVPYHAWREVLEGLGLGTILEEPPPPKLLGFYLLTPEGRIQTKVEREDTDSDLLSNLASTLVDSVHDPKGQDEVVEGGFTLLSQDGHRLLLHRGSTSHLGAIVEGMEDEAFLADMMALADKAESIFSGEDIQYEGGESDQAMDAQMRQLLDSEIYEGIDYAREDPKLRQNRLFELIALGLSRKAGNHPVCVAIDDLQWADPSRLALLHYVARNTRKTGALLLGTYRMEEAAARPHLRDALKGMEQEDLVAEMDLNGLTREDLPNLAESFIGPHILSDDFLDHLWRETRGFPLFVREVLLGLEDDGEIVTQGVVKRLVCPLDKVALPKRVRDVIRARLDRLPREDRRLLDAAATCGTRFTAALVSRVAGEEEVKVLNGLSAIARVHGLLRPADSGFTFDHPAVQEVLYDGVPTEARQSYHREAAEWLELAGGPIEDIGEHYYRAHDPRAASKLCEAGDAAFKRYANVEAVRFYTQASEVEQDIQLRCRILESLASVQTVIGKYGDGISLYREALSRANGKRKSSEILSKIAFIHYSKGEHRESARIGAEALALVVGKQCREEALAHKHIGIAHTGLGEFSTAIEQFEKCMQISKELGDKKTMADTLGNIGVCLSQMGDLNNALKYCEESLSLREEEENASGIVSCLNTIACVYSNRGKYTGALGYFLRSLRIAERTGQLTNVAMLLNNIAIVQKNLGELDVALGCANRSREICERIGNNRILAHALGNIGMLYLHLCDYNQSLEFSKRSLMIDERIGNQVGFAGALNYIGMVYEKKGDLDRALENHLRGVQISERIGHKNFLANHLRSIGKVHAIRGDFDLALGNLERALAICRELGGQKDTANTLYVIGFLQKEKGEYNQALKRLMKSFGIAKEIKATLVLCDACCGIAEVHLAHGNLEKASEYCNLALSASIEGGWREKIAESKRILGMVNYAHGMWQEAKNNFEESIAIFKEIGYLFGEADSRYEFGFMWKKRGDLAKAEEHLHVSVKLLEKLKAKRRLRKATGILANLEVIDTVS